MLAASNDGFQPGFEFWHVERFDQIVIGTGLKSLQLIAELISGRQHDDRRGDVSVVAQSLAYRQAVDAGQHDVEHDGLINIGHTKMHGRQAVTGVVNNVTTGFQVSANGLGQFLVVFDEQYGFVWRLHNCGLD